MKAPAMKVSALPIESSGMPKEYIGAQITR
jgi:hypothetical protein